MTPLDHILDAFDKGTVLVATDFDGTISDLVPHPDDAHANPRAVAALNTMAEMDAVGVAVVSGRSHSELQRLLPEASGWVLVGEHGNDVGGEVRDPRVADLAIAVSEIARDLPGSYVEVKANSVAFHWRRAEEDPGPVLTRLRSMVVDGARILDGKKVMEFTFGSRTKADAVLTLAEAFDTVIFLGDDVTDENAFAALTGRGITIKVGEGETSAVHRMADVEAVVELLESVVAGLR